MFLPRARVKAMDDHEVNTLTTALQALYRLLLPVIEDANSSQAHRTASYETFMKDPNQAQSVAQLITNVTIGNAMYPPQRPWSEGNPTFLCVKPGMLQLKDPDGSSQDAHDGCQNDNKAATYVNPTPYIILCPVIFRRLPPSPPTNGCPRMSRRFNRYIRRKMEGDRTGSRITLTHTTLLFHEIVHYYLCSQPGYLALEPEALDINDAWRLPPDQALRNAENYVYYAYTTAAKCTEWPNLRDDRELLEVTDDPDDGQGSETPIEDVLVVKDVSIQLPESSPPSRR
ncbi:MAG: hypothetical protein Q9186_007447 [Xanthomendoza sp. 1 TL-2023]